MTDISQVLYEKLSTDKYGGWVEVFGRDQLRVLCDRVEEEIQPVINEELAELSVTLEEAEDDIEKLIEGLNKIGLDWDDREKKVRIGDDFREAVKQLRI